MQGWKNLKTDRMDNVEASDEIKLNWQTDIAHWPELLCYISTYLDAAKSTAFIEPKGIESLVLWTESMLLSPFDISKILSEDQLELLKTFLLYFITSETLASKISQISLPWSLKKHVLNCLAVIAKSSGPASFNIETYSIFGKNTPQISFFCFLKKLSIISESSNCPIPLEFLTTKSDDESIVITRYKIKILSHISNYQSALGNMKCILKFMNHWSSKLGWTLFKAILRISKFIDKNNFISDLLASIGESIFSNEQCWINVLTTISFILSDNTHQSVFENVCKRIESNPTFLYTAIRYDKEFVHNSKAVREAGLFLIWSLVRFSNFQVSDTLMTHIVFSTLFDREFATRKAAMNVLHEILARCQVCMNMETTSFENDTNLLFEIESAHIKRRENNVTIFSELENKNDLFRDMLNKSLYSFDRETREISASVLSTCFDPLSLSIAYETPIEMDGVHQLIIRSLKFNINPRCVKWTRNTTQWKKNIDIPSLSFGVCTGQHIIEHFKETIDSFTVNATNFPTRNMSFAIRSYLKLCTAFKPKNFKINFLFLIKKDFDAYLMQSYSQEFFDDVEFSSTVLSMISLNGTGVLANSNNKMNWNAVLAKYEQNLLENRFVHYSIDAMRIAYRNDPNNPKMKQIHNLILDRLSDYSVGFTGDDGYLNRQAALFYFLQNRQLTHSYDPHMNIWDPNRKYEDDEECEGLIIRFLADKSRKLRDQILVILISSQFNEFGSDFPFLVGREHPVPGLSNEITSIYYHHFVCFFKTYSELIDRVGADEAHILALFSAFSTTKNFWIGIKNTFKSGDSITRRIIKDTILQQGFQNREEANEFLDTTNNIEE